MSATRFRLEDSFAYHAYRLARALRKDFFQISRSLGSDMFPEQWFVMNMVHEQPGQTQTELASRMFEDKPSLSRTLKSLEARGYILCRPNPHDGRSMLYYLTEEGDRVFHIFARRMIRERKRIAHGLTKTDYREYRRIVDVLLKNLD